MFPTENEFNQVMGLRIREFIQNNDHYPTYGEIESLIAKAYSDIGVGHHLTMYKEMQPVGFRILTNTIARIIAEVQNTNPHEWLYYSEDEADNWGDFIKC